MPLKGAVDGLAADPKVARRGGDEPLMPLEGVKQEVAAEAFPEHVPNIVAGALSVHKKKGLTVFPRGITFPP
ncbi:MAG TPA: hypothetical protein VFO85_08930 [Vicinamibacteria bacterium]|nr:hypothetical protein [Vicinamibacteria bacterium]